MTAARRVANYPAASGGTADELRATAENLISIARHLEQAGGAVARPKAGGSALEQRLPQLAAVAEIEYGKRRARARHLPRELLGEPGWDILLDLLVQQARGKRTSVTSACVASGVARTTGLRWITALETCGLVKRIPCPFDRRIVYLELTRLALQALDQALMSDTAGVSSELGA